MENELPVYKMLATTLYGLEEVLAGEISEMGGQHIVINNRAVAFSGNLELMYRVNYFARTALRVFRILKTFPVHNADQLYRGVFQIPWLEIMDIKQSFMVSSVIHTSNFKHSGFVALRTKDAIADRFRDSSNARPSVDTRNPEIRIMVHISADLCTVSLDSSGESLHKRGYRKAHGVASLNEVLAAGMIRLSGWDEHSPFMDPMCGSGTLPVEAALIAAKIPPGYFRQTYTFMNWKTFDRKLFQKIKQEFAPGDIKLSEIYASDRSERQVRDARLNIESAGLSKYIRLRVKSFEEVLPRTGPGWMVTNPPYGERVKEKDIGELYRAFGNYLKRNYAGWNVWFLNGMLNGKQSIGLHPTKKMKLMNGELKCMFQEYVLYAGSRKE